MHQNNYSIESMNNLAKTSTESLNIYVNVAYKSHHRPLSLTLKLNLQDFEEVY